MKKKICVITSTRAEYGLLRTLIRKLIRVEDFDVRIIATGAHLSKEFGLTYMEIEKDGFKIDAKIEILLDLDTPASMSKSMAIALYKFSDYFSDETPDMIILLGDRYEILAVAIAAMNQRIPIAHIHGGETTEGAIDESIRHALTKLSYLHFASTDIYRKRIIQLGESPDRVFNVGALGVENITKEELKSRGEVLNELGIPASKQYALVTYHPVTLENNTMESQIKEILEVCKSFENIIFIFTASNADCGGRAINREIEEYAKKYRNILLFKSLGSNTYLSAMNYCSFVLGNSSSGIIEAPSFKIPVINIGDRQKGRIQVKSVINCKPVKLQIEKAINKVLSDSFKCKAKMVINPYGDGNTSDKIVDILRDYLLKNKIDLKKKFFDCEVVDEKSCNYNS